VLSYLMNQLAIELEERTKEPPPQFHRASHDRFETGSTWCGVLWITRRISAAAVC
jgi:hypothetical protein